MSVEQLSAVDAETGRRLHMWVCMGSLLLGDGRAISVVRLTAGCGWLRRIPKAEPSQTFGQLRQNEWPKCGPCETHISARRYGIRLERHPNLLPLRRAVQAGMQQGQTCAP